MQPPNETVEPDNCGEPAFQRGDRASVETPGVCAAAGNGAGLCSVARQTTGAHHPHRPGIRIAYGRWRCGAGRWRRRFCSWPPHACRRRPTNPAYHFRTIDTAHFSIHYHEGEGELALRLTGVAEETWRQVSAVLGVPAPARTHVILVDQTEEANGWATPVPRDTVMITAAWPRGIDFIGSVDDWLRVAFAHEFTHIVHLDQSRGWALAVRRVFGRVPLGFPNLLLPTWQVEGLATLEESRVSGEGRLYAGDFAAIVGEAARTGHLEPLDRVNGGLVDWPAGYAPYAYGLGFEAYLADRFGADAAGRLATASAGTLPYFWPLAFRRVYGVSLGAAWKDYQRDLVGAAASKPSAEPGASAPRRLTHVGYLVSGPRITPPECAACPPRVVYSVQNPQAFPAIYERSLEAGPPVRLVDRFGGHASSVDASRLFFDRQDLHRNAGVYSDLFVMERQTGLVRRLTRGARLSDPDISPDGRTHRAAVRDAAGQRELVLLPSDGSGTPVHVIAAGQGTQFNTPRWSPDGRTIAVERHRLGAYPEIVTIDVASRELQVVAASARARWVTPAWRPDGRAIIAAADLDGGSFDLYEIALPSLRLRRLTDTSGATWPAMTPDGRTLVYVGYTPDGFDLFSTAYPPGESGADQAPSIAPPPGSDRRVAEEPDPSASPNHPYRPWRTWAPSSWFPTLEDSNRAWRVGAEVAGADVLEMHRYAASASWFVSRPGDTPRADATGPDWTASYAYARFPWQPWVSAERATSSFGAAPDPSGTPPTATIEEHRVEIGLTLPRLHIGHAEVLRVSWLHSTATVVRPASRAAFNRSSVRAAWEWVTAKQYGYSISPEDGVAIGGGSEFVRRSLGADASATIVTADARAYLPGLGRHHVAALRVGAGASLGSVQTGRVFLLGGGAAAPNVAGFGDEAFSLLRGFPPDSFAATRVVLVNAEYRLPLAYPQHGVGVLPGFLRAISASLFADGARTWLPGSMTASVVPGGTGVAIGAELSGDLVLGYWTPVTATVGAAWGHDDARRLEDGWRTYVRIGRAF